MRADRLVVWRTDWGRSGAHCCETNNLGKRKLLSWRRCTKRQLSTELKENLRHPKRLKGTRKRRKGRKNRMANKLVQYNLFSVHRMGSSLYIPHSFWRQNWKYKAVSDFFLNCAVSFSAQLAHHHVYLYIALPWGCFQEPFNLHSNSMGIVNWHGIYGGVLLVCCTNYLHIGMVEILSFFIYSCHWCTLCKSNCHCDTLLKIYHWNYINLQTLSSSFGYMH